MFVTQINTYSTFKIVFNSYCSEFWFILILITPTVATVGPNVLTQYFIAIY